MENTLYILSTHLVIFLAPSKDMDQQHRKIRDELIAEMESLLARLNKTLAINKDIPGKALDYFKVSEQFLKAVLSGSTVG
jgi:hypothetical protein